MTKQQDNDFALNTLIEAILDKKGFNVLILDVRNVSTFTDYFIIAEGNVERHTQAISQNIIEAMKKEGWPPLNMEGDNQGDWVVLDFGGAIVHLFKPGLRNKYALEELWKEGEIVHHPLLSNSEAAEA